MWFYNGTVYASLFGCERQAGWQTGIKKGHRLLPTKWLKYKRCLVFGVLCNSFYCEFEFESSAIDRARSVCRTRSHFLFTTLSHFLWATLPLSPSMCVPEFAYFSSVIFLRIDFGRTKEQSQRQIYGSEFFSLFLYHCYFLAFLLLDLF